MEYGQKGAWLSWCIPAGSLSGVPIGIHWTFPLFFVWETLSAGKYGGEWAWTIAITMALLFVIVLAHEFGHVFAARAEGIATDRVMLWPLGGLAYIGGERLGAPEVRIAGAGPAVNLAFAVIMVPVLWLAGIRLGLKVVNPFDWWPVPVVGPESSFGQDLLYCVYKINLIVMLFNLIPAFPMDGGRILRGLLHSRFGPVRSMLVTTTISFVFCAAMLVWAIASGILVLGLIAVFTAWGAWQTRKHTLAMAREFPEEQGFLGHDFSMGHTSLAKTGQERKAERKEKREEKRRRQDEERERRVSENVDILLDKISREGIESLTRKERAFLDRASRRRQ